MALIHCGKDKRYAFLPEPHVETAPDLATLLSYAEQWGLRLRAYEMQCPDEIISDPEIPSLLLLREEGRLHMVFLAKARRHRFLLLDPSRGKRWIEGGDLLSRLTGVFLSIEGYEKKGEPVCSRPPSPSLFLSAALALPPFLCLFGGLVSLDFPVPTYVPIAFFASSLLFGLLQKAVTYRLMERFDSLYLDGVDEKNLKRRRDLYVHYHTYKRAAFLSLPEALGRLLSLLAALAFVFFHDLYLAAAAGCVVSLTVLFHLLFGGYKHQLEVEAEGLETSYFQTLINEEQRRDLRLALKQKAHRYASFLSAKDLLSLLSCGLFTVLFCLAQGVFSAQIVIFYLLSLLFLNGETDHLFLSHEAFEQRYKEGPYFVHNIASRIEMGSSSLTRERTH